MTSPSLTLKMILLGEDRTASGALKTLAGKASSLPAQLAGPFSKIGSMIGGEVGELTARLSEGLEKLGEEGTGLGTKFAAGGAALAGIGAAGALIGSKDKASLEQLKTAITDSGAAYSDYQEEIEKTISKQENFGNSAVATQNALATLTAATGDPTKAIENMGLVSDLAAAKHISLGDASTLVSKILNGAGGKTLKQYGITTKDAGKATEELAAKLKGQASAAVDSWGGKLSVLKTKIGDQVAILGQKFGPALTVAGTGIAAVGTVTQFLTARKAAAAVATAAAAAATEAATLVDAENVVATEAQTVATEGQSLASKAAAAAQWLLNLALDANPIVLIIGGLVALGAAMYIAYQKSATFRDIIDEIGRFLSKLWDDYLKPIGKFLIDDFKAQVQVAIDIVKAMITAVKGIITAVGAVKDFVSGAITAIVGFFTSMGSRVKSAVVGVFDSVVTAARLVKDWVKARIDDIVGFFAGLGGRIAKGVSGAFDAVGAAFQWLYDHTIGPIIDAINTVDNFLGGGKAAGTYKIPGGAAYSQPGMTPHRAMGGPVTAGMPYIVGENRPELFVPNQSGRIIPRVPGQFGTPIEVHTTVMLDSRVIGGGLERLTHTGGPLNIRITGT